MKHYILKLACYLIFFSQPSFSYVENIDKIKKEHKKIAKQIKLEKGGIAMLEQHLVKHGKYNKKDSYLVNFICDKKNPRKLAKCRMIEYEVLSKK